MSDVVKTPTSEFTELVTEAREIAAIVPTSRAGEVLTGLADAVEAVQTQLAAEAEKRRTLAAQYYASAEVLQSRLEKAETVIVAALNFDDHQTVNGVTDRGWLSPNEWYIDMTRRILEAYRRSEGNNND